MKPAIGEHDTTIGVWRPPRSEGPEETLREEELLVSFDEGRSIRVLVLPALFDEANRMRRFTVEVMRHLHRLGIDSILPDLPGCNESLAPLDQQTLSRWRNLAEAAGTAYEATHVLAIRAGALIAPPSLPGWRYAPQSGPRLLRAMLRARIIASREAAKDETREELLAKGRKDGLVLAGWSLGRDMIRELELAEPPLAEKHRDVSQSEIGGAGLWLRAEPGEAPEQSLALANFITDQTGPTD